MVGLRGVEVDEPIPPLGRDRAEGEGKMIERGDVRFLPGFESHPGGACASLLGFLRLRFRLSFWVAYRYGLY